MATLLGAAGWWPVIVPQILTPGMLSHPTPSDSDNKMVLTWGIWE